MREYLGDTWRKFQPKKYELGWEMISGQGKNYIGALEDELIQTRHCSSAHFFLNPEPLPCATALPHVWGTEKFDTMLDLECLPSTQANPDLGLRLTFGISLYISLINQPRNSWKFLAKLRHPASTWFIYTIRGDMKDLQGHLLLILKTCMTLLY